MSDIPTGSIRPPCRREDAEAVLRRLRESGHVAYFAGGCVRDLLLGLEPKDWDIATNAPPPRVRQLFPRTQAVGAKFGVILVRQNGSVVEVATFRTDVAYKDGRHPTEVRFSTPEEDAQRRDFTINGLFLDPLDLDRVIDFVGGREDLNNKLLRAIGDANLRFEEDHLRMLRAVRFAARFELTIEQDTANAIVRHAEQLKRISPERIAEELRSMLMAPSRARAWRLLWDLNLTRTIFRELPVHAHAALRHERSLLIALDQQQSVSFGLALAAAVLCYRWQNDAGKHGINFYLARDEIRSSIRSLRKLLRISNEELDEVEGTLEGLRPFLEGQPRLASLKRFLQRGTASASIQLLNALIQVGEYRVRAESFLAQLANVTDWSPPPLLTGDDLTAAGYRPGPAFKRVLDQVYDAQLEDQIKTKDEALELARKLMP
jgi:tRNA nucleotidyltransferase/poly(A) polymerase